MLATVAIRRGILGAVLATVTLSACTSGDDNDPAPRTPDPVSTPVDQPAVAARSLGAVVRSSVLAGFTLAPERSSHTGPTNLTEAISLDSQSDAKSALVSEGFQAGYQRLWTNTTGELIAVQVYRFATAGGASANFARAYRLATQQAQHVGRFTVQGHSPNQLRGTEVDVEGNLSEQVIGVRGHDVLQVLCTSRTEPDLRGRVSAIAVEQFDRIAATR